MEGIIVVLLCLNAILTGIVIGVVLHRVKRLQHSLNESRRATEKAESKRQEKQEEAISGLQTQVRELLSRSQHLQGLVSEGLLNNHGLNVSALFSSIFQDLHLSYSYGKVGSMTVANMLRQARIPGHIRHVHYLSRKEIERLRLEFLEDPSRSKFLRYSETRALLDARRDLEPLAHAVLRPVGKTYVLTGVRDPISQLISAYFQFASHEVTLPTVAEAITAIHALAADPKVQQGFEHWFRIEMRENFELDALNEPFDKSRGWQVYQAPAAKILIFRMENMANIRDALSELYGMEASQFELNLTNRAESKPYAGVYREVQDQLKFSRELMEQIYGQPFSRHFYTDKEREAFIQRWSGEKIAQAAVAA